MGAIQQFIRVLFAAIDVGERAQAVQYLGPEALQALSQDFRRQAGIDPETTAAPGEGAKAQPQPQRGHAELRHRHHPLVLGDC